MPDTNSVRSTNILIEGATYAAIIIVCLVMDLTLEHTAQIQAAEEQTNTLYRTQSTIATRIQQSMNNKLLLARGLAGAISLSPDITHDEFEKLCAQIKVEDTSVVNMALVQENVITHVHPFNENADILGSDLGLDPDKLAIFQEIEKSRKTVIEGPSMLLQGYTGFIIREPIRETGLTLGQGDLLGVASIVFSATAFFEEIHLNEFTDQFDIAVKTQNVLDQTEIAYGDETVFDRTDNTYSIALPTATWTLAMAPHAKSRVAPEKMARIRFATFFAALSALLIARYLHMLRSRSLRTAMQLRSAMNAAPSAFVLFDAEDRLELCNRRYITLHGLAGSAISKGATLESILRAGLAQGLYLDAIGNEEAWLEHRLQRDTMFNSTGTTLALSDGTWVQLLEQENYDGGRIAIMNDITAPLLSRKRAKVAEQRLNDAIDALPVAFWLFDKDDALVMFNTAAGEMLDGMQRKLTIGRSLKDLVGRRLEIADEVHLNGKIETDFDRLADALHAGTSDLEACYEKNRWFKYYTRRTSEDGLVMFRVEITDLRHNQLRLEASNAELRAAMRKRDAAESRLQNVADLSSEWFWEQDAEMRITYVSEGFQRTMGLDPANYLGKFRKELITYEDDVPPDNQLTLFKKMLRHEPFRDFIYSFRFTPDKESWIRISGKPLFDESGTFTGYIGTAEDVTRFYAALREAEQADEAKTQFLNVISHELRTPLSAVLGFNSFVENFQKLPSYTRLKTALEAGEAEETKVAFDAFGKDIRQFSGRIQAAGIQLKSLIDDMLDLARIEANTTRVTLDRVDSKSVVQSVVEQMHTLADEKSLTVTQDLVDVPVMADETRFRQILTNVLGNAFKFTDAGTVAINSYIANRMVVFEVQDSGIGISEDRVGIVFDRFAQAATGTGTNRKNPGVGLGLAICKDLAALQNGWIKVESELGKGTKMIFALPCWSETN
jgi:PAS domain S-box-containing protein